MPQAWLSKLLPFLTRQSSVWGVDDGLGVAHRAPLYYWLDIKPTGAFGDPRGTYRSIFLLPRPHLELLWRGNGIPRKVNEHRGCTSTPGREDRGVGRPTDEGIELQGRLFP